MFLVIDSNNRIDARVATIYKGVYLRKILSYGT